MKELTPDYILEGLDPKTKKLFNKLRKIILETIPEAKEKVWRVWNAIGYRHPEAGTFCGIFVMKDGIRIYFMHGKLLKDPSKILQGEHLKMTKFMPIKNEKDIKLKAFKTLLREAVQF